MRNEYFNILQSRSYMYYETNILYLYKKFISFSSLSYFDCL